MQETAKAIQTISAKLSGILVLMSYLSYMGNMADLCMWRIARKFFHHPNIPMDRGHILVPRWSLYSRHLIKNVGVIILQKSLTVTHFIPGKHGEYSQEFDRMQNVPLPEYPAGQGPHCGPSSVSRQNTPEIWPLTRCQFISRVYLSQREYKPTNSFITISRQ